MIFKVSSLIFNCSLAGDVNVSYSFDFGDETYLLSTCPNATHTYTRTGYFLVKASARNNISGPIMTSVWVFIQSSTGLVCLNYPKDIVEAGNETEITVTVSQGTWMKAEVVTSPSSKVTFNISGENLELTLNSHFQKRACVIALFIHQCVARNFMSMKRVHERGFLILTLLARTHNSFI